MLKTVLQSNAAYTAGDRDCVAAVERLPVLRFSVDFILFPFWKMDFIVAV